MRLRLLASALFAGAVALIPTPAQAQNEDACKAVLDSRFPGHGNTEQFCTALSGFIFVKLSADEGAEVLKSDALKVADIFSQRDLQNPAPQAPELSGTPAQGHSIPGVQPAGVASGTIAALGTRAGQDAIAALSVNPAVLFLAEAATEQLARLSRLADVTVFIPVSSITGDDRPAGTDDGKLRYFGTRVRLNFTGSSSGSAVWKAADELLRARISSSAKTATAIEDLLRTTSNPKACAEALLDSPTTVAVTNACGAPFGFTPDMAQAARLREALVNVRRAADAKYLGVDVRIDFGDPTMGEVADARGRSLFAGVAVGRRFIGRGSSRTGVRARLGLRHAKLDTEEEAEFAAEGGAGIELSRFVGDDELNLSTGIEFRFGNAPDNLTDQFQTNFTMLRGSLLLPITSGNSLSINVGAPVSGDVSPIFSVNFNWGLLLSDRPGLPR